MTKPSNSDQKESAASMEAEVLRRMLTTPPKPHDEKSEQTPKKGNSKQK